MAKLNAPLLECTASVNTSGADAETPVVVMENCVPVARSPSVEFVPFVAAT